MQSCAQGACHRSSPILSSFSVLELLPLGCADRKPLHCMPLPELSWHEVSGTYRSNPFPSTRAGSCLLSQGCDFRACRFPKVHLERRNRSYEQAFLQLEEHQTRPTQQVLDVSPEVHVRERSQITAASIRCYRHRCNGRSFSSLGNYMRHLREKSGRAKSFTCERCRQKFTRSTAKNKHIKERRCQSSAEQAKPV